MAQDFPRAAQPGTTARNVRYGRVCLLAGFALAGSSAIAGAMLSPRLGGFTIAAASLGIAAAGLAPLYGRPALRALATLPQEGWRALGLQAVLGIFLYRVFLLQGVRLTSAAEVGILLGATPAITALLAWRLLDERPTRAGAVGAGLAALGVMLLQGLAPGGFTPAHLAGNGLALCAAASEAAFTVLARKRASTVPTPPLVSALLVIGIAFVLCVPPALLESPLRRLATLRGAEWLTLAWYGLAVTALGYACFYAGVARVNAYTVAAYAGAAPLSAVLLSAVALRQTLLPAQWIGAALILTAMALFSQSHAAPPSKPAASPAVTPP